MNSRTWIDYERERIRRGGTLEAVHPNDLFADWTAARTGFTVDDEFEILLMQVPRTGSFEHANNDQITIRMGYDFEPHGRASECWEDAWYLTLHMIPHHWQAISGWRKGNVTDPKLDHMHFRGRTERECKAQACEFLRWWLEHGRKEKQDGNDSDRTGTDVRPVT